MSKKQKETDLENEKKIEPPPGVIISFAPTKQFPKRKRVQLFTGSESPTEQAHKDDCDINQVVAKYSGDELRALMNNRPAIFADLVSAPSYQQSLDIVRNAEEQFNALPSKVRKEFDNDPRAFLAFVEQPKNAQKLIDLGLATKRAEEDPPASRKDINRLIDVLTPKPPVPDTKK